MEHQQDAAGAPCCPGTEGAALSRLSHSEVTKSMNCTWEMELSYIEVDCSQGLLVLFHVLIPLLFIIIGLIYRNTDLFNPFQGANQMENEDSVNFCYACPLLQLT